MGGGVFVSARAMFAIWMCLQYLVFVLMEMLGPCYSYIREVRD